MNQFDFHGKNALITGGTRGIGRAVAERLLRSGASVYVWGLNGDSVVRAVDELSAMVAANYLRGIYGKAVDVRVKAAVVQGVDDALLTLGHVDVLVNAAGVFGPAKSALAYSLAEWEDVIRTNLTSQFLVCRALVPHMVKRGYGRVVNVASVIGRDAVNPLAPAYSAAKAGVIRFTQALARETAETGVLLNCVAPSAIKTAFFDSVPQAQLDAMVAKVPMGRIGQVEDVVELICWLASSGCTYSTGAVFDCSGGRHE